MIYKRITAGLLMLLTVISLISCSGTRLPDAVTVETSDKVTEKEVTTDAPLPEETGSETMQDTSAPVKTVYNEEVIKRDASADNATPENSAKVVKYSAAFFRDEDSYSESGALVSDADIQVLERDAVERIDDNVLKEKTFEYNGKLAELNYKNTIVYNRNAYKVFSYEYDDADYSINLTGKPGEHKSYVSFFEDGSVCQISGSLLGKIELTEDDDNASIIKKLEERFADETDFSIYDVVIVTTVSDRTVSYTWKKNTVGGAYPLGSVEISLFDNGYIKKFRDLSRLAQETEGYVFDEKEIVDILEEKLQDILKKNDLSSFTINGKWYKNYSYTFKIEDGKPCFDLSVCLYYQGDKINSGDEYDLQGSFLTVSIKIDEIK